MKIVKQGVLPEHRMPEHRIWMGVCSHCDSEIEAEEQELKVEYDKKKHVDFANASCPVCSRDMIFYPKIVPPQGGSGTSRLYPKL